MSLYWWRGKGTTLMRMRMVGCEVSVWVQTKGDYFDEDGRL